MSGLREKLEHGRGSDIVRKTFVVAPMLVAALAGAGYGIHQIANDYAAYQDTQTVAMEHAAMTTWANESTSQVLHQIETQYHVHIQTNDVSERQQQLNAAAMRSVQTTAERAMMETTFEH